MINVNENIWAIINQINNCENIKTKPELNNLQLKLKTQIEYRYSGLFGIFFRIYDWVIRNNIYIDNAQNTLQQKIKTLNSSQKEIVKKIDSIKKIIQDTPPIRFSLEKPIQETIEDLKKRLGSVDDPQKAGQFNITFSKNQFSIKIGIPYLGVLHYRYHECDNSDDVEMVIKNITDILKKNYVICSSKTDPKPDRCFYFENNKLFYHQKHCKPQEFDLTKRILVADLDKLYERSIPAENIEPKFECLFDDQDPTRTRLSEEVFIKARNPQGNLAFINTTLVVNSGVWRQMDSSVTEADVGRFACMGFSTTREVCTVDYEKSTVIQNVYGKLKEKIEKIHEDFSSKKDLDLKGLEEIVLLTIQQEIIDTFDKTDDSNETTIVEAAKEKSTDYVTIDGQKIPLISLDVFIEKRIGICRHRAMLFSVLASRLKKDGLLLGEVRMVRDIVKGGAHAWNLYCSPITELDPKNPGIVKKPNIYLCDAMWNTFGLIDDQDSYQLNTLGYLCPTKKEKSIIQKLQNHIDRLTKSINKHLRVVFLNSDTKPTALDVLTIRNSSGDPNYVVESTKLKNISFTVPKKTFSLKVLKIFIEAYTNTITEDVAKKIVNDHLKKIGGQARLCNQGTWTVYSG